jgi:hypothetical protein
VSDSQRDRAGDVLRKSTTTRPSQHRQVGVPK